MRPRSILIPVAAAAVTLLLAPQVPGLNSIASAQSFEDATLSVGTFYSDLSIFGDWIAYQGAYVFVPRNVDAQWRPYTLGQWVYFQAYGWLWVSDEPFGWATYHYGRWGHSDDIGWYWVPGRQWAPAWVAWRRSGNYVAWAPLPPGSGRAMSAAEVAAAAIPARDWTIVPARDFLDSDMARRLIRDDRERLIILRTTRPLGRMMKRDNVVVDDALDLGFVESRTKRKVVPAVAGETRDPRQAGQGSDGKIMIFPHDVRSAGEARPRKIGRIDEIAKQRAGNKPLGEAPLLPKYGRETPAVRQTAKPEVITPPRQGVLRPSQPQSALRRMEQPTVPRAMPSVRPQAQQPYFPERLPGKL